MNVSASSRAVEQSIVLLRPSLGESDPTVPITTTWIFDPNTTLGVDLLLPDQMRETGLETDWSFARELALDGIRRSRGEKPAPPNPNSNVQFFASDSPNYTTMLLVGTEKVAALWVPVPLLQSFLDRSFVRLHLEEEGQALKAAVGLLLAQTLKVEEWRTEEGFTGTNFPQAGWPEDWSSFNTNGTQPST